MHNYAARRTRLQQTLNLQKSESFLVTNIVNVEYLTGFTGSSGSLLVLKDREQLLSDTRYATQLATECPDLKCDIRDASITPQSQRLRCIQSARVQNLHFEADSLTKAAYDQLESELTGVKLISTSKVIEKLRSIKDASEIAAIRSSIAIAEKAFKLICSQLQPEQTELEISHNLEHQLRKLGASGFAFEPIIAVGARSALPHGHPTNKTIIDSPLILFDWGARVDRYLSDLTRILVTAKIPPKLREIYEIVLRAQTAAIETVRPGVAFTEIDHAARQVIESSGYSQFFGHGIGHSFGLEIHEFPFLSPIHDGKLEPGMIITIEPGIYLPEWGGVRIEDDILVTQNGFEVLSELPKELDQCLADFV